LAQERKAGLRNGSDMSNVTGRLRRLAKERWAHKENSGKWF
jgi:hypothetical protein